MAYEIYLHPKNKEAAEILRGKFKTLDDKFIELHKIRVHNLEDLDGHGLTLYGEGEKTFVHTYAEWELEHMQETMKDLRKAAKIVLGPSKGLYEITMSG